MEWKRQFPSPGTCRMVAVGVVDNSSLGLCLVVLVVEDDDGGRRRRLFCFPSRSHSPGMRRYLEIKKPLASICGEGFQGGKWLRPIFSPFKDAPGSSTVRGMEDLEADEVVDAVLVMVVDVVVASVMAKHPTRPTKRVRHTKSRWWCFCCCGRGHSYFMVAIVPTFDQMERKGMDRFFVVSDERAAEKTTVIVI